MLIFTLIINSSSTVHLDLLHVKLTFPTAYTLLKFGIDSYGKRFPVYLAVWGHGASVFQSIIEIPFVYFMDLTVLAIRIPTAICSVINL